MGGVIDAVKNVASEIAKPFNRSGRSIRKMTGLKAPDIDMPAPPKALQASLSPVEVRTKKKSQRTTPPPTLLTGTQGVDENLGSKTLLGG